MSLQNHLQQILESQTTDVFSKCKSKTYQTGFLLKFIQSCKVSIWAKVISNSSISVYKSNMWIFELIPFYMQIMYILKHIQIKAVLTIHLFAFVIKPSCLICFRKVRRIKRGLSYFIFQISKPGLKQNKHSWSKSLQRIVEGLLSKTRPWAKYSPLGRDFLIPHGYTIDYINPRILVPKLFQRKNL